MKQIIIILVVLLATAYSYASCNPAEEAEHWEKVRQMDQLAERFKAETGFTGSIEHNLDWMRLSYFEGKFAGIQITATADTASFRAAFDQILTKVLPYTFAKREQLTRSRITNIWGVIQTDYYQQINGYRVEGAGRITINYDTGRNGFAIGNGTVELPETVKINYDREEATNKAVSYHKSKFNQPDHQLVPYVIEDIRFFDSNGSGYALKYIIYIGDFVYYVDASTGRIDWDNVISDN